MPLPTAGYAREASREKPRAILLGLGNDLLTDDAIGLRIAAALAEDPDFKEAGISVLSTTEMGLSLLDFITGYDTLIIVDSIQTGNAEPGFLHEMDDGAIKTLQVISPHFPGIGEMLALGRQLDLPVPSHVTIFAIEVADPFTVGTTLSAALESKIPQLVQTIRMKSLRIMRPSR